MLLTKEPAVISNKTTLKHRPHPFQIQYVHLYILLKVDIHSQESVVLLSRDMKYLVHLKYNITTDRLSQFILGHFNCSNNTYKPHWNWYVIDKTSNDFNLNS